MNMMDEVRKHKLIINSKRLSELLGVEVYETSALKGEGLENLEDAIKKSSSR